MKAFVALISVSLLASPALAQSMGGATGSGAALTTDNQDAPESTGAAGQAAGGERRICRRVETASGSRMSYRRVCRTAAEWRDAQRGS